MEALWLYQPAAQTDFLLVQAWHLAALKTPKCNKISSQITSCHHCSHARLLYSQEVALVVLSAERIQPSLNSPGRSLALQCAHQEQAVQPLGTTWINMSSDTAVFTWEHLLCNLQQTVTWQSPGASWRTWYIAVCTIYTQSCVSVRLLLFLCMLLWPHPARQCHHNFGKRFWKLLIRTHVLAVAMVHMLWSNFHFFESCWHKDVTAVLCNRTESLQL